MKKRSLRLGLSLIPLVLCACSQDWSGGLESARLNKGDAGMSAVTAQALPVEAMPVSQRRKGQGTAFANHPDTGSLVHYASQVAPRRTGAYTWHAADLSEEHAFRAMTSGEMTFQAPDGTPIKLAYQRHIEHPDGNWSWVGEAADGQTAVITFGEEAVFGTIPQGNDQPPLRLTLSDGRAWVVSADKRLLAQVHNEATHPTSPDYLVPPSRVQAAGAAASSGVAAMAAPATAKASSAATTVIDVLVGYTNGFAASRGSQSAAQTRIRNLVDITNQAYVSSQIDAELRLVHSMQVTFPDNTANEDALEKLTGFRAPSTQLPPDPAFSGLRQARETYGADLVVLVRKFNDPENEGCGIAWLLGGGESGITPSDEYFGYSVVSDGQDTGDDGKTYFCREETFAHEVGHNLGSQHDIENSKDDGGTPQPGAYAYSYGYKTGSSQGNFFTIMAYGDPGQTGYQVFSNPNITICGGRACGTASANNARSINNTAAIIAGFRDGSGVSSELEDDSNLDGRSDIFWHSPGQGRFQVWQMNGSSWSYAPVQSIHSRYAPAGIGDFNGDGRADVLWIDTNKTTVWVWLAKAGSGYTVAQLRSYPTGWNIVGVADVNGDGRSDIVWHNVSLQRTQSWLMNGTTWQYSPVSTISNKYRVSGIGDFNGDGYADIVWKDLAETAFWVWIGNAGGTYGAHYLRSYPAGWTVVGVDDANGDGRDDLIWHNPAQQRMQAWFMNGTTWAYAPVQTIGSQYRVASTGDFNGDGKADIIWTDTAQTQVWVWLASGNSYSASYLRSYPTGWALKD